MSEEQSLPVQTPTTPHEYYRADREKIEKVFANNDVANFLINKIIGVLLSKEAEENPLSAMAEAKAYAKLMAKEDKMPVLTQPKF
jgi:hypothetical protein